MKHENENENETKTETENKAVSIVLELAEKQKLREQRIAATNPHGVEIRVPAKETWCFETSRQIVNRVLDELEPRQAEYFGEFWHEAFYKRQQRKKRELEKAIERTTKTIENMAADYAALEKLLLDALDERNNNNNEASSNA